MSTVDVTTHAAVDFIVAQIVDEAARRAITVSDVERKVLYFAESADTPRSMVELMEAFERDYDESEYEQKISDLLRSAHKRTRSSDKDAWAAALKRLRHSDVYLGVMLDRTGLLRPPGDTWRLLASGTLVLAAFMGFLFGLDWLLGHPTKDEAAFYAWAAALAVGVGYTIARWILGAEVVDSFIDKVISLITFGVVKDPRE